MTDPHEQTEEVAYRSAVEVAYGLAESQLSSVELVRALLERIERLDAGGPSLRSVLFVNENAEDEAGERDAERSKSLVKGPLHGVPVLVKDNVDTAGRMPTTAGSFALSGPAPVDAAVVQSLRDAGAIILGKANLSEWANFRGRPSSSGWSPRGGQTRNPHCLDRSPGGSSAGSGAAVAAGLVPLAIGTETDGSILCPAAACGVVGLKPTVGLVSRTGIVPISGSQDTAGPMARSVGDVALLLDVLVSAPRDPNDPATADRPERPRGFFVSAVTASPVGMRVGVVRGKYFCGYHKAADAAAEVACGALTAAGVELVDPVEPEHSPAIWSEDELVVLSTEFRSGLLDYLARRGRGASGSTPASLDDIIEFNRSEAKERLELFGQELLEYAAATKGLDDPTYLEARARNWRRTRKEGIDALCETHSLDALIAPTMSPAWLVDHVNGDTEGGSAWSMAAVAGYPSISVPVFAVNGLPVGVALWAGRFAEAKLITLAAALEREVGQAPRPAFAESVSVLA